MFNFSFGQYLERIRIIEDLMKITSEEEYSYIGEFYEAYLTYCDDEGYIAENLDDKFFKITGRKEIKEVRFN